MLLAGHHRPAPCRSGRPLHTGQNPGPGRLHGLADLFGRLHQSPGSPFTLLAVFGIGYTSGPAVPAFPGNRCSCWLPPISHSNFFRNPSRPGQPFPRTDGCWLFCTTAGLVIGALWRTGNRLRPALARNRSHSPRHSSLPLRIHERNSHAILDHLARDDCSADRFVLFPLSSPTGTISFSPREPFSTKTILATSPS